MTVAFDEEVQNVTTQTFTLVVKGTTTPVPATVTFSPTSGRWVLNPNSSLTAGTVYTATVTTGVTDLAGNAFAGMTWSFTTA